MHTDTASATVLVSAPLEQVLALLRDIEAQPQWVAEIKDAVVDSADADGTPLTARIAASTPVGTDRYTLRYEHSPDGMQWHLVEGRMQTAQDAVYALRALDAAHTEVTFTLTISHNLPLPGFLRSRTIKGLVASNTGGLVAHFAD